ncbi:MAG: hypothetical protein QM741_08440 [Rudaea sp.]|uniref:hypothetical protein n=1 Tax=Rudaea sp. TaxID=2136325 RepID=UPI0039E37A1C
MNRPGFRILFLVAALALAGMQNAAAADVVVQPAAGSGFVVKDSTGAQVRLRVDEGGNIVMPVLVNGTQQSLPVCYDSASGQLGPCSGSGNSASYSAGTGLALNGSAFSVAPTYQLPQGCASSQIAQWNGMSWVCTDAPSGGSDFALPYSGTTATTGAAFSVANTSGQTGVRGINGTGSGTAGWPAAIWGDAAAAVGVLGTSSNGNGVQGVTGSDAAAGVAGSSNGGPGISGESANFDGVHGHTSSNNHVGVAGFADQGTAGGVLGGASSGTGVAGVSQDGIGVSGHSDHGYAFVAYGPAQQGLNQGGWVKAAVVVDQTQVVRCFNSQLAANSAAVVPCGIAVSGAFSYSGGDDEIYLDFNFPVDGRFVSVTGTNFQGLATAGNRITLKFHPAGAFHLIVY